MLCAMYSASIHPVGTYGAARRGGGWFAPDHGNSGKPAGWMWGIYQKHIHGSTRGLWDLHPRTARPQEAATVLRMQMESLSGYATCDAQYVKRLLRIKLSDLGIHPVRTYELG